MATVVGFFGKLPSHGDFLERNVPGVFREVWDAWLQQCVDASRRALGERWLDCYLTSPIWRFFICDGVAGPANYGGVLLPSVDRVGRYFPLTVVVELPIEIGPLSFAEAAADWFDEIEPLCAAAVENLDVELGNFEQGLAASSVRLTVLDQLPAQLRFAGQTAQWRWPLSSTREVASAVGGPLMAAAHTSLRPLTLWWTDGSERVEPSVLLVRGLPRPESFAALLAGGWNDGHWEGMLSDGLPQATHDWRVQNAGTSSLVDGEFEVSSGGATDMGAVRTQNQDNLLISDDHRIWAVADGMGGHSHGELASQMIIDALNATPLPATLNTALEAVTDALARVNADLRRAALRDGDRIGATVVALVIRGALWAISWAGDSRAYLYRAGTLSQLTRDHSVAASVADSQDSPSTTAGGEITRAVGGEDMLELDHASDQLMDGDRFLLCSDGLYGALSETEIVESLRLDAPADGSRALIEAARTAGARDNVTAIIVAVRSAMLTPDPDAIHNIQPTP